MKSLRPRAIWALRASRPLEQLLPEAAQHWALATLDVVCKEVIYMTTRCQYFRNIIISINILHKTKPERTKKILSFFPCCDMPEEARITEISGRRAHALKICYALTRAPRARGRDGYTLPIYLFGNKGVMQMSNRHRRQQVSKSVKIQLPIPFRRGLFVLQSSLVLLRGIIPRCYHSCAIINWSVTINDNLLQLKQQTISGRRLGWYLLPRVRIFGDAHGFDWIWTKNKWSSEKIIFMKGLMGI